LQPIGKGDGCLVDTLLFLFLNGVCVALRTYLADDGSNNLVKLSVNATKNTSLSLPRKYAAKVPDVTVSVIQIHQK
jgi:hypothetical protein